MSEETFPYDEWVNEALRSVLSRALQKLAEHGPIGDHHFFINFDTSHDGVDMPGFLRAQYPEEITIVLQHQFEELIIDEQGFEVSLSFSGKKSHLTVPFDAVTSFADPSVNFGLQIGVNSVNDAMLQAQGDVENDADFDDSSIEINDTQDLSDESSLTPFAPAKQQPQLQENDDIYEDESDDQASDEDEADDGPKTAEVIALDAFRKK